LSGGRSVLISRVHHCLVDGVSGVGLMNVMLDPAFQADTSQHKVRRPPPLPLPATSLVDALATSFGELVQRVLSAQSEALDVAQALASGGTQRAMEQLVRLVPELAAPVERLPFNQPCSAARKVAWAEIPMADVKTIREACGGTLNDVVLTVVTSAVRRYAELHGAPLKGRLLRLMVPVNLRREGLDNGLGNRVSMLPVGTPLDVRDPVRLLDAIRQRTEALKSARVADWIHLAATWMGVTPVPLQAAVGPYSGLLPVPPFHMVCTNVPGPQVPLYALGRKMLTYHPYVPIGNQMGLCCAVQSYNQTLYFGFTGDARAVPDVARLKRFLDDAFRELRQAARAHAKSKQARPKTATARRAAPNREEQPAAPVAVAEVKLEPLRQETAIAELPVRKGVKPPVAAANGAGAKGLRGHWADGPQGSNPRVSAAAGD